MIGGYQVAIGLLLLASKHRQSTVEASLVDYIKHQAFSDALTSVIYKNENECSSALGVSLAFSLIYPGCTGKAVREVQDVLGYLSGPKEHLVWNETSSRLV